MNRTAPTSWQTSHPSTTHASSPKTPPSRSLARLFRMCLSRAQTGKLTISWGRTSSREPAERFRPSRLCPTALPRASSRAFSRGSRDRECEHDEDSQTRAQNRRLRRRADDRHASVRRGHVADAFVQGAIQYPSRLRPLEQAERLGAPRNSRREFHHQLYARFGRGLLPGQVVRQDREGHRPVRPLDAPAEEADLQILHRRAAANSLHPIGEGRLELREAGKAEHRHKSEEKTYELQ